jgi:Sulfotransferase family
MPYLAVELAFVASQPRSGSTLLQRLLAGHPDVATASEPWIMLPLFYARRPEGWNADFGAPLCHRAIGEFLKGLPGGEDEFRAAVGKAALELYASAARGRRLFIDKTPRYSLVLGELGATFPEARFVFLYRNPMAVLASVIETWASPDLFALRNYEIDLVPAPGLLLAAERSLGARAIRVQYEALVTDPAAQLRRVCAFLGLDFRENLVEYGSHALPTWELGDKNVYAHDRPSPAYQEAWRDGLGDAQRWRLQLEYLELLGADVVRGLGYDYGELRAALGERQPARWRLLGTQSLASLAGFHHISKGTVGSVAARVFDAVSHRGPYGAVRAALDLLGRGRRSAQASTPQEAVAHVAPERKPSP